MTQPAGERPEFTSNDQSTDSRAKAIAVAEAMFEGYGEPGEGGLEGIVLALVYVGDCIREAGGLP